MTKENTMSTKEVYIRARVSEYELEKYRNAALDQRYMNFSQFVRDAIEEKIKRGKNDCK